LAHNTSKFVFLRADGKHSIWNEDDGITEKDGHWYSNSAYLSSSNWYAARPSLTVTATATASTHVLESGRAWAMLDEDEREYQRYVNDERDRDAPTDEHEQEYTAALVEELQRYGFHEKTLKDVEDLLGLAGIEALHDLI
jgi:DNA-directed RNA polymerase specialized sigma54-like protein